MPYVLASYDEPSVEYDSSLCTFDGLLEVKSTDESATVFKRRHYKKIFSVFEGSLEGTAVYSSEKNLSLFGTVLRDYVFVIPILGTAMHFVFEKKAVGGVRAFESTTSHSLFGIKHILNGASIEFFGTKRIFSDAKSLFLGTKKIKQIETRLGEVTPLYNVVKDNKIIQATYSEKKIELSGTKKVETGSKILVTGKRYIRHILELLDLTGETNEERN